MDAKTIKKYQKVTLPNLIKAATRHFNAYIRIRDENLVCISCGRYKILQAGHFYSGGHHSCVRFNEDNVNGQCERCNFFLHGNLTPYRENLIKKIGHEKFEMLDKNVAFHKRVSFKWDRFSLIEIIEKYKAKIKTNTK